jgi:hypothetical protein
MAEARILTRGGRPATDLAPAIQAVMHDHLSRIDTVATRLLDGSLSIL